MSNKNLESQQPVDKQGLKKKVMADLKNKIKGDMNKSGIREKVELITKKDVDKLFPLSKRSKDKRKKKHKSNSKKIKNITDVKSNVSNWVQNVYSKTDEEEKEISVKVELDEDHDWWTRYYDSTDESTTGTMLKNKTCTLKIYTHELEAQPEFDGLTDTLQIFKLYKGKRTGDEFVDETNITGIFKGNIRVYKWPLDEENPCVTQEGYQAKKGFFQSFPPNTTLDFVLRIYCIKGIHLRPKDADGRSDPYIVIKMSDTIINDRQFYVPNQVNPIFGKNFELKGQFPKDHAVVVSVWDYDLASADDLIGETKVDVENRFYTKHRAHCGISAEYHEFGHCAWRDSEKPCHILSNLCEINNVDQPVYAEDSVRIVDREFRLTPHEAAALLNNSRPLAATCQGEARKETLALTALRRWEEIPLIGYSLVPEHVETRSLFHPSKYGVEQGKIQLWIDIFPICDRPPPRPVDITPRKPTSYELRVTVWNTEDVILEEDDFFLGEKMSDIYVKGWLISPNESQCTDVHYRSMTGEGNFNWRFIFPFMYLSTENKLVVKKRSFTSEETEIKLPCKLILQIWDNDLFSADDFLGTVSLELAYLPRGARTPRMCRLDNLEPKAPTVNLFKIKRTRGWWPCRCGEKHSTPNGLAGKLEIELEVVTAEDAAKYPAGLGRSAPQPLPPPNRPDTSLSWFKSPLKAFKFLICKPNKCKIITFLVLLVVTVGVIGAVYSTPGYAIRKFLHL